LEAQTIPTVAKSMKEIFAELYFEEDVNWERFMEEAAAKDTRAYRGLTDRMRKFGRQIIDDRNFLVENVFKRRRSELIVAPVHIRRLVSQAKVNFAIQNYQLTDLTPMEVLDKIDELTVDLLVNRQPDTAKVFHMLLRYHLHPRMII
jgi:hypothetical protein